MAHDQNVQSETLTRYGTKTHPSKNKMIVFIGKEPIRSKIKSDTVPVTPWCSIIFEKLTIALLVKKLPELYGTQRFITVLTRGCQWTPL
jgi:hypothetical protein